MISKRKSSCTAGTVTGAKCKTFRTYYNSLSKKEQEEWKEFLHDGIGGLMVFAGLCVIVVLMLLVG